MGSATKLYSEHRNHWLAEVVELGDRMYFFDRADTFWTIARLKAHPTSPLASFPSALENDDRASYTTLPWQQVEPLTLVEIPVTGDEVNDERRVTFEELQSVFENWKLIDDVWNESFLQYIHLQPQPPHHRRIAITLTDETYNKLRTRYHTTHVLCGPASNEMCQGLSARTLLCEAGGQKDVSNELPATPLQGPYFISGRNGRLMAAHRLHEDTYETFIQSVYSSSDGKILSLPIHASRLNHLSVGVPSRLHSKPVTPEQPLSGLRFSVKDVFHINELGPPSLGSRAWVSVRDKQRLHRNQEHEAFDPERLGVVEVLRKMGAVFVGKNKLSEFAFAGPYHWQNTDYLLNFNPRADGLQSPSDSSGGSASAVAAYDWLDFAIGTDTGGSIRLPADANGVYGGRPTTGAIFAGGISPLAKSLDTLGVLARDPEIYCKVLQALLSASLTLNDTSPSPPLPVKLKIVAEDGHNKHAESPTLGDPRATGKSIFETFVSKLETSLDVRKEHVNLELLWDATKMEFKSSQQPLAGGEQIGSLGTEFGDVYRKIVYWESYRDLGAPFLKAYSEANDGRLPLVNNNIKAAWKTVTGGDITESMYQEALSQRDELKCWVSKYLTEDSSPSVTLLVNQSSKQGEELRDTQSDERYFAPSKPGQVLPFVHLSTLADLTDHHVPIGQFECPSSVTGLGETYPLTASITMVSGGENALLRLIQHLHRHGVLDSVKTGRKAF